MKLIIIIWLLANLIMLIFAKQVKTIIRQFLQQRQINTIERDMLRKYEEKLRKKEAELKKERESRLGKATFSLDTEQDGPITLYKTSKVIILQNQEIQLATINDCTIETIEQKGVEHYVEKEVPLTKEEKKKLNQIQFVGKKYTYVPEVEPDSTKYIVTIQLSIAEQPAIKYTFSNNEQAQKFKTTIERILQEE